MAIRFYPVSPIPVTEGDVLGFANDDTPDVRIVFVRRKGETIYCEGCGGSGCGSTCDVCGETHGTD